MFFRFGAAITLVTCISLAGIALEKQNLALKRAISLQYYRVEILQEKRSRLILQTHRLGAISRLADTWSRDDTSQRSPRASEPPTRRYPLLEWRLRGN